MKSKIWKRYLLLFCFGAGFLSGILYENLVSKSQGMTIRLFHPFYLEQYSQMKLIAEDYFVYVTQIRVFPFVLLCLSGCFKWRKIAALFTLGWTGFLIGVLIVSAVIQLGLKGIFVCIASFLPHFLFYGMAYGIVILHLFFYPKNKWSGGKTLIIVLVMLIGIITETYLNPYILNWIIQFV